MTVPGGTDDDKVFAAAPGHLRTPPPLPGSACELFVLPKRGKRIERGFDLKNDVAALAAVAAIGSAARLVFLTAEMHHAVAAFA
jgi:hypothetical protein